MEVVTVMNPVSVLLGFGLLYIILIIMALIAVYFIYGACLYGACKMVLNEKPSFRRSLFASLITFILYILSGGILIFISYSLLPSYSNNFLFTIFRIVEVIIAIILQIVIPVAVIKYTFDTEDRWGWAASIYIVSIFFSIIINSIILSICSIFISGFSIFLTSILLKLR